LVLVWGLERKKTKFGFPQETKGKLKSNTYFHSKLSDLII
jgi:hypothetical protein